MDVARKSEKIADLASMFADLDLEIIENVLEMCEGKVNRAAEVLLKMQDDGQSPIKNSSGHALNQDFLELGEDQEVLELEENERDPREVVNESENLEREYMEEMQKAIELSLEAEKYKKNKTPATTVKKSSNLRPSASQKPQVLSKSKETVPLVKKIEKNSGIKEVKAEVIEVSHPDEEVIQFIFTNNNFIRGESLA